MDEEKFNFMEFLYTFGKFTLLIYNIGTSVYLIIKKNIKNWRKKNGESK